MTSAQHRRWLLYQCVVVSLSALAMVAVLIVGVCVAIAGFTWVPNDIWRRTPGAGMIGSGAVLIYGCVILYVAAMARSILERRLAHSWGMVCDRCGKCFTWDDYQYFVAHNKCSCSVNEPLAEWRVGDAPREIVDPIEVPSTPSDNPYAPPVAVDPPKPRTFQRPDATTLSPESLWNWLSSLAGAFAFGPFLVGVAMLQVVFWPLMDRWRMWRSGASSHPWLADAAVRQRREFLHSALSMLASVWLVAIVVMFLFGLVFGWPTRPADFTRLLWIGYFALGTGVVVTELLRRKRERVEVSAADSHIIPYDGKAAQYRLILARPTVSPDPLAFRFRTVGGEGVILNVYDEDNPQILLRAEFAGDPENWRDLVLSMDQPTLAGHDQMKLRFVFDSADRKPWIVSDCVPKESAAEQS